MAYKIRKIPSLVDFHSLYQLLHSQVYHNGLKLWISNVKICIDKWTRLPKIFAVKNLRLIQKSSTRWFNQKKAWRGMLKIDACKTAKHKIILSQTKWCTSSNLYIMKTQTTGLKSNKFLYRDYKCFQKLNPKQYFFKWGLWMSVVNLVMS